MVLATQMINDSSRTVVDATAEAMDEITRAAQMYFGTNTDRLPKGFLSSCLRCIMQRCPGATVNDIIYAYSASPIEKKPFQSITVDELLSPVETYWFRRTNVVTIYLEVKAEATEEERTAITAASYRAEAMELFTKSFELKKWTGDDFQAFSVWKRVVYSPIDTRVGRLLWDESRAEMKRRSFATLQGLVNALPSSREIIFSGLWAKYVCSRQTPLRILQ